MIFFVIYYKNDKISQFSFIFSIRPHSQILFLLILISFTCSAVLPYSLQLLFLFFINYSLQSYQLTNPNIPQSKLHPHRQFKMISLAFYLLSSILPNSLVLYSFFFFLPFGQFQECLQNISSKMHGSTSIPKNLMPA